MDGGAVEGSVGLIHSRPSAHPPRRGPFAALSKIVRDRRVDPEPWGGDRRLFRALPPVELPSGNPFKPYEGFEHNDAGVLACGYDRTAFSLTINHYNVWRLASMVKDSDWHGLRRGFPVTLRFEDVGDLRVVQQREEGNYRILRSSLDGLSSALWDVIALRCVGADADRFRFSLEFNGRRSIRTQEEVANVVTILIECGCVSVEANLRQNWIESVGADSLPLLEALLRRGPVQGWNVPDLERFVADRRTQ